MAEDINITGLRECAHNGHIYDKVHTLGFNVVNDVFAENSGISAMR